MFPRITLLVACLFISVAAVAAQQSTDGPLLIGRVAVNQTHIAFTYSGKIWLVERTGGVAKRLTKTNDEEGMPVFSPDGRRIAFSKSNGNDWDVFIAAADGSGEPARVTMMPEDDFVTAWSPDGREVIFETTRDEESLTTRAPAPATGVTIAADMQQHCGLPT
jgi:tricorn protease